MAPDILVRGSLSDLEDLGVEMGDNPTSSTLSGVSRSASVGVIPVDRLKGWSVRFIKILGNTLDGFNLAG